MKHKIILVIIVNIFLFTTGSFAQEPGEWSKPAVHPCYQGITVSVKNMGYSKNAGGYLWGIQFTNDKYSLPVSFKYKLSIGEKVTSKEDWKAVDNLKKGDSYSDAHDKFTAWTYASSSEEWYVYIWDVCFHEMRCGGADECFAECDKTAGKENQLCGLSEEYKPTPGSNQLSLLQGTAVATEEEEEPEDKGPADKWEADDKAGELQVIKKEDGLLVKLEGEKEYRLFKKIGDKTYRHEEGKDFDIIKFSTDDKFSYWHNGVLQNHYTLVKEDDGESKVRSGRWSGSTSDIKITVTKDGLIFHLLSKSSDDGSPFFKKISATEYRRYEPDGILFYALKLQEDGTLQYSFTDKPGSYFVLYHLTFLSADEEDKSTNGEDKYSFKGTKIWKHPKNDDYIITIAELNGGLIRVSDVGFPTTNIHISKPEYKRVAQDKYQEFANRYKNDSLSTDFLKLISIDKLVRARYNKSWVDTGYYKKEKRGKYEFIVTGKKDTFYYRYDTLSHVATRTAESLPKATTQNITIADVSGLWNNDVKNYVEMGINIQITAKGDEMLCIFGTGKFTYDKTAYTYKKTSINTYEFKPNNGNGAIGRIVFLSPTRICLSYVYKNYVSIGYYNKPAVAPIVKQENKPVTVTENKTVTNNGSVSGKWYIGYWHLNYTADYSATVEEVGDNLTIRFAIEPNSGGINGYEGSLSGKIITAKKSSPYQGQYKDIVGAPVWRGTYPAQEGMIPCSWVYVHDGGKEMLIMIRNDGSVFKHYKTRYHQGY